MHFERLVIEAGKTTFSLDVDPHLTVIAGVGRLERDGLINELVSALGTGRPGVHLELASDAGTRYTIFRPLGARHRVIDVDREHDVTSAFVDDDGVVNLLGRAGLDEKLAARQMRIFEADLLTKSNKEEYILTLAHVDQGRLWDVASKVEYRAAKLGEVAEAIGSTAQEAEAYEEIERRHHAYETALERHERMRHLWFMISGITAVGTIPAAMALGTYITIPMILVAVAATMSSIVSWQRLEGARRREKKALREAGAQSYLNFQVSRVNGLVSGDHQRKSMITAAGFHRSAMVEWKLLAGDIPVEWALEHAGEVRAAAARLRDAIGGQHNPMAMIMSETEETTADVSHALLQHLDKLNSLGVGGESFPAFLDDPFANLPAESKPALLELLLDVSQHQQVIYLTEDPDIASWARAATATGRVAIVEPASPAGDDHPRRSRHVAA